MCHPYSTSYQKNCCYVTKRNKVNSGFESEQQLRKSGEALRERRSFLEWERRYKIDLDRVLQGKIELQDVAFRSACHKLIAKEYLCVMYVRGVRTPRDRLASCRQLDRPYLDPSRKFRTQTGG